MNRRALLKSAVSAAGLSVAGRQVAHAAVPKMKITRVRVYAPDRPNPLFNQSDLVVTVETDAGITGIGEGGARDTLEQSAGRLIGQDPQYIERLWQDMTRAFFYPPGREKIHAIGALDLALWDIKGKVLGRPVHSVLGGMARNFCECYPTGGVIPGIRAGMSVQERAQAREGVGKNGDWCVDFHQRFDLSEAVRGCELIKDLAPYFVEDPVRDEAVRDDQIGRANG